MKESAVYFDDVEISDINLILERGHENPLAVGTRDRITYIPGLHGAIDYGADLEPIPFNLPMGFVRSSRVDIQSTVRKIKSLLLDGSGKPKTFKLKFGYEPDKYYNVRYSGNIPIERLLGKIGEFNLPLICFDGYAQSVVKNNEVTWGSNLLTFTAPYMFGHKGDGAKTFTASGTTNITVTGNDLRPVINVSGSGTNVKISWNGKTMELGTFSNSNWVIDLKEFEATKDGKNALDILKGDWLTMELEQGKNIINVNGSGLNLDFRVEFRDRYF